MTACVVDGELVTPSQGAPAASASHLDQILESGVLRVGTTGDWNPMSYKDAESGDSVGHDIDLVTQLAADLGVELELVPTDWKNLVSGVVADKYDITTSASLNPGRAKVAAYTMPYAQVGTVPMMLAENEGKFTSWEDINQEGVKVAITLGTVFEEQAKAFFPNAELIAVESPARDYQEVLAGRADVSITSNIEASTLIQTYAEMMVVPVDSPRNQNGLAMLVAQNDQVWLNYVNSWITMKQTGGFFDGLESEWLAVE
ncbi:MAG: transporter substrate-binding domain-containing protein [Chloroflexota bacterium]